MKIELDVLCDDEDILCWGSWAELCCSYFHKFIIAISESKMY